jgi:DNA polymerase elongation subunit (family B)
MISPDAAKIRVKDAMVVDVVYGDERSLLAVLEAVQDLECTKDSVLRGVECEW